MRYRFAILSIAFIIFASLLSARGQGVTQVVAGPNGSQFRVVATFIPQTPEDTWKMQSVILDTEQVKRGTQPSWFMVDLTTSSRNLDTDEQKQKFMLLRWTPGAGIQTQCTQGWVKATGGDIDKVMDAVRSLYQLVPVETRQPVQMQLPKEVELKLTSVLDNLELAKPLCTPSSGTAKQ